MARRDPLQAVLEDLRRLRGEPDAADALDRLRQALRQPGPAVARAARLVKERAEAALGPELEAAFGRLLEDPVRRDPGCAGKLALLEALLALEHDVADVYQSGIHHVQREPVWGGSVDTAVELRAWSALGLARCRGRQALDELAELLGDPEPGARAGAARALGATGCAEATAVLRLKVRVGDPEPQVLSEALLATLRLCPERVAWVASLLDDAARQDAAADALGESRLAAAFAPLRDWFDRALGRRDTALRALAALRSDEAYDFVLACIAEAGPQDAAAAIDALAPAARADARLRGRVEAAATDRGEPAVQAAWQRLRGPVRGPGE